MKQKLTFISNIVGYQHLVKAAMINEGLPPNVNHILLDLRSNWGDTGHLTIEQLGLSELRRIETSKKLPLYWYGLDTFKFVAQTLDEQKPDLFLIYGDLRGSASAVFGTHYSQLAHRPRIVHIEAGLVAPEVKDVEQEDIQMIDEKASFFTTHSREAYEGLLRSGKHRRDVFLGINPITAAIDLHSPNRQEPDIPGLDRSKPYVIATIHRVETLLNLAHFFDQNLTTMEQVVGDFPRLETSDQEALPNMLRALDHIAKDGTQVVFIQYGSTKQALERLGWRPACDAIIEIDTLPFWEYTDLLSQSSGVITDSSGVLVEAAHLGKPALVLRSATHRKGALTDQTFLGGVRYDTIMHAYNEMKPLITMPAPSSRPTISNSRDGLNKLGRFLVAAAQNKPLLQFAHTFRPIQAADKSNKLQNHRRLSQP